MFFGRESFVMMLSVDPESKSVLKKCFFWILSLILLQTMTVVGARSSFSFGLDNRTYLVLSLGGAGDTCQNSVDTISCFSVEFFSVAKISSYSGFF